MKILYLFIVSFSFAMYRPYSPTFSNLMFNKELQQEGRFHLGVVISLLTKRCFVIPNESFAIKERLHELITYLIPSQQLTRINSTQTWRICSACIKKQFPQLSVYLSFRLSQDMVDPPITHDEMMNLLYVIGKEFFGIKTNEVTDDSYFIYVNNPLQRNNLPM